MGGLRGQGSVDERRFRSGSIVGPQRRVVGRSRGERGGLQKVVEAEGQSAVETDCPPALPLPPKPKAIGRGVHIDYESSKSVDLSVCLSKGVGLGSGKAKGTRRSGEKKEKKLKLANREGNRRSGVGRRVIEMHVLWEPAWLDA